MYTTCLDNFTNIVSNHPRSVDCTNKSVRGICQACNKGIDFLTSALILEILLNANISIALLISRLRPNILRYTLLYEARNLENVGFLC